MWLMRPPSNLCTYRVAHAVSDSTRDFTATTPRPGTTEGLGSGRNHLERGGMPVHDAVGVNCKKGTCNY